VEETSHLRIRRYIDENNALRVSALRRATRQTRKASAAIARAAARSACNIALSCRVRLGLFRRGWRGETRMTPRHSSARAAPQVLAHHCLYSAALPGNTRRIFLTQSSPAH